MTATNQDMRGLVWNITIPRNDVRVLGTVTCEINGVAVDVSNDTFESTVRSGPDATDDEPVSVAFSTDGTDGKVVLKSTAQSTAASGRFRWDVQWTRVLTSEVITLVSPKSRWVVEGDITHA